MNWQQWLEKKDNPLKKGCFFAFKSWFILGKCKSILLEEVWFMKFVNTGKTNNLRLRTFLSLPLYNFRRPWCCYWEPAYSRHRGLECQHQLSGVGWPPGHHPLAPGSPGWGAGHWSHHVIIRGENISSYNCLYLCLPQIWKKIKYRFTSPHYAIMHVDDLQIWL